MIVSIAWQKTRSQTYAPDGMSILFELELRIAFWIPQKREFGAAGHADNIACDLGRASVQECVVWFEVGLERLHGEN